MNSRQCYPCTACCEGWLTSKHIEMSPGSPCQHCTAQGCAIYESRPVEPCVTFKCGWLQEESPLPDDMRPDLCGAIVQFDLKWQDWTVFKAAPTGRQVPVETLEWLMTYARETGIPLLFQENRFEDGRYVECSIKGYGSPAFLSDVKNVIKPEDIFTL